MLKRWVLCNNRGDVHTSRRGKTPKETIESSVEMETRNCRNEYYCMIRSLHASDKM